MSRQKLTVWSLRNLGKKPDTMALHYWNSHKIKKDVVIWSRHQYLSTLLHGSLGSLQQRVTPRERNIHCSLHWLTWTRLYTCQMHGTRQCWQHNGSPASELYPVREVGVPGSNQRCPMSHTEAAQLPARSSELRGAAAHQEWTYCEHKGNSSWGLPEKCTQKQSG